MTLFNGPIEVGVRTLALLVALHPRPLDLNELVILDYLIVHSADLAGGPPSLHPASPLRSGEVSIRRTLIEDAVTLLKSRLLAREEFSAEGIRYSVGDYGTAFLDTLDSDHSRRIRARAKWIAERTNGRDPAVLLEEFAGSLEKWRQEFATIVDVDVATEADAWAS